MKYMERSRFWACDFWALLVILTCSVLLRTASGDPRTAVAGEFYGNNANHEKNPLNYKLNSIIPNSDQTRGTFERHACRSPSLNGCSLHEYLMEKAKAEVHVYSFGVLIFEIVTGKRCMMAREQLLSEVWYHYNNHMLDVIVNERIRDENRKECIMHVIYIGLSCTLKDPSARPTMAQVVKLLSGRQCGGAQVVKLPSGRQCGGAYFK